MLHSFCKSCKVNDAMISDVICLSCHDREVEDKERERCAKLVETILPIAEPVTEDAQRMILRYAASMIRGKES